jgi:hypothetical protein
VSRPTPPLLLLVLVLAACGPSGARFAVQEAVVRDPGALLAAADRAFERWLEDVPHDVAPEARCYLESRPAEDRAGDYHIETEAWCGPVLTLDHEPDHPWSILALTTEPDAGGRLLLAGTGGFEPASRGPDTLRRADGDEATPELVELTYPEPPALPEGHVAWVEAPVEVPTTGPDAVGTFAFRGSKATTPARLELRSWLDTEFGQGRSRARAPEGHELVLVDVVESGAYSRRTVDAALHVEEAVTGLDAGELGAGQLLAVVPAGASVSFHTTQEGVVQVLDLRDGELEQDARATAALQSRSTSTRLRLDVAASWTATYVVEDAYFGDWSYEGASYGMEARCDHATTSLFDLHRWGPEGHRILTVECGSIAADHGAELPKEAVEASASLQVDGRRLAPADVSFSRLQSGWGYEEVGATYTFHVPLGAERATFVFEGHAYIDDWDLDAGVRRFSPSATADVPLR